MIFKSYIIWVFLGCIDNFVISLCFILIRYSLELMYFLVVNVWKVGDNYLDWYGVELGQGFYGGFQVMGFLVLWMINQKGVVEYSLLNM